MIVVARRVRVRRRCTRSRALVPIRAVARGAAGRPPPAARVRRRREPRAPHAAHRHPLLGGAPPAPPRRAGRGVGRRARGHRCRGRPTSRRSSTTCCSSPGPTPAPSRSSRCRWTSATSRPTPRGSLGRAAEAAGVRRRRRPGARDGRGRPGAPPPARHDPRRQRDPPQPARRRRRRSRSGRRRPAGLRSRSPTRARAARRRTCRTSSTASGGRPARRRVAPASASRSRSWIVDRHGGRIGVANRPERRRVVPRRAARRSPEPGAAPPPAPDAVGRRRRPGPDRPLRAPPAWYPRPILIAGPVRPAYRSCRGRVGGSQMRMRMPACGASTPRHAGSLSDRPTDRRPHPPLPRADSIVDPRVGDAGPALLALEDGTVFPGIAFGAPVSAGGDLVVNTSQTGLPGDRDRPLVRGPGRRHDLPADRQLRPPRRATTSPRDPWLRGLIVAHATAAVLDDARQLATLLRVERDPGHRRRRHPRPRPAPALDRLACAGSSPSPAMTDHDDGRRAGPRRAALGGPGLRRPGLAAGGPRGGGRPRRRRSCDRRLRAQGEHRQLARPARRARPRAARIRRPPRRCSRPDVAGVVLSPGPGDPARLAGPVALARCGHRRRPAAARDLPRPPDRGPRGGRRDDAGSGSATTAPTTRSRTSTRATSRSPRRTTRSRSSATACPRAPGSG